MGEILMRMYRFKETFFCVLIILSACNSQKPADKNIPKNSLQLKIDTSFSSLKSRFNFADSILLVGHLGIQYNKPGHNNPPPPRPLILLEGKLNSAIIKKQVKISKPEVDTLMNILFRSVAGEQKMTNCDFDPHHAILFFKNGVISYIDLCFMCQQFDNSDDLGAIPVFDDVKWIQLENLYKKLGVRYYQYKNLDR
ncbi:MAG: hypothetical protein QM737_18880 [Ferruginibacter sp.]